MNRGRKRWLRPLGALVAAWLWLAPIAPASATPPGHASAGRGRLSSIRAALRRAPRQRGGLITPGQAALIRARFSDPHAPRRRLHLKRGVYNGSFREPTFRGRHPMFRRLLRQGWFTRKTRQREKLQKLADSLELNKRIDRKKPISEVEFVSFDLEATGQAPGRWDRRRGNFLSGWGEISQFGYTVHKGGKIIDRGTINIRPSTRVFRAVARLNPALTNEALQNAPRFEQVAEKILRVLKGRVLVGQSAQASDWGWMRSNFARLGVDLPKQSGMILDTYLMSHNHFKRGAGVEKMANTWNIPLVGAHDAQVDAKATAAAFFKMLELGNAKTLGDAFHLQSRGMRRKHNISALARQRTKARKAAARASAHAYLAARGVGDNAGVGVSARGQTEDGRGTRVRVSVAGERYWLIVDNESHTATPEDASALHRALSAALQARSNAN